MTARAVNERRAACPARHTTKYPTMLMNGTDNRVGFTMLLGCREGA